MSNAALRDMRRLIATLGVAVMAVSAVVLPDVRYPSLLFMLLGLIFLRRENQRLTGHRG
jgi:hypothetical protein